MNETPVSDENIDLLVDWAQCLEGGGHRQT
jgi:hypothetical protein